MYEIGIIAGVSIYAYMMIFNRVMRIYEPGMTYGTYLQKVVDGQ